MATLQYSYLACYGLVAVIGRSPETSCGRESAVRILLRLKSVNMFAKISTGYEILGDILEDTLSYTPTSTTLPLRNVISIVLVMP